MKIINKTFYIIATILLIPIVAAGFFVAIPAIAFYKGFELAKSMIDRGEL